MNVFSSSEAPFHLTIRFTTGHDDLPINIANPSQTTTTQLKKQIRAALPEDIRNNRLRLIAAGKLLQNGQILSNVLKAPLPPPPPPTSRKGKEPVLPQPSIYINCSIGDKLSDDELEAENDETTSSSPPTAQQEGQIRPPPRPEPRGFDRLLSSMSAQEVAELRAEFMAVQASRFTPDTMPSPTTLRRMEDAWLDEGGDGGGGSSGGIAAHGAHGQELDDFFWGNLMGFLWPIGIIGWGGRDGPDGGLWSDRRKTAVWTGVAMSLAFGIVREMS